MQSMQRKARILLIEDNPADVKLVRMATKSSKWVEALDVSSNGQDAFSFLKSGCKLPSLILLDLNMPGMNGFEFLEKIKSDSDLQQIPVVVLSTSDSGPDIDRAYRLHAAAYVTKEFDYQKFCESFIKLEEFWFGLARKPPLES